MINKKKVRKGAKTSRLVKVLTASLVLNPALYMLTYERAFVEAVSTSSYKAPYVSKALPDFHTNTRTGTATVSVTGTAANGGIVSDTFDVAVIPDSRCVRS